MFIFLDTECPICAKYQGEFYRLTVKNPKVTFYYVFCGQQNSEAITGFCAYDSIPSSVIVLDKNYKLAAQLHATITPQAIVMKENKIRYSGKINDRFPNLGSSKPQASINYVNNALISLGNNESVQIPYTKAVGCFIEPK